MSPSGGLGTASEAEIRVPWADGAIGPSLPAAADQFVLFRQDAESVEAWQPTPGTSRP
jgi:hypothetical protein